MKKILVFLLIAVAVLGCKKRLFDNRAKYIGKYDFKIKQHEVVDADAPTTGDTTINLEKVGAVDYGDTKNQLLITIDSALVFKAVLDDNGNLTTHPTYRFQEFSGKFPDKTTLTLTLKNGSTDTWTDYTVVGKKQASKK